MEELREEGVSDRIQWHVKRVRDCLTLSHGEIFADAFLDEHRNVLNAVACQVDLGAQGLSALRQKGRSN